MAAAVSMLVLSAGVALASSGGSSTASQTLSEGSTGKAVKQLQKKLHVRVTGYYGTQTKTAVRRFQRRNGLAADGVAGPATLKKLRIRVTNSSYATGGSSAESGGSGSSGTRLPAVLKRIAQCESGGNPRAISANGKYRGKYQFDRATWKAAGGTGDPAAASEATQDKIALALYKKRGTAPWPNCA